MAEAQKRTRKPKATPVWPDDPPLESMIATLANHGLPGVTIGSIAPPDAHLRLGDLMQAPRIELAGPAAGNVEQVDAMFANAGRADKALRGLSAEIRGRKATPNLRANHAALNLLGANGMISAAFLLHLDSHGWHDHSALVILRSALELVASAAVIVVGTGPEATRWIEAARLSSPAKRADAWLKPKETCAELAPLLHARQPDVSRPFAVYEWLCRLGPVDLDGVGANAGHTADGIKHEHAYAALAYVSWASAVVAEEVTGATNLAIWPSAWPAKLPW